MVDEKIDPLWLERNSGSHQDGTRAPAASGETTACNCNCAALFSLSAVFIRIFHLSIICDPVGKCP